MDIDEAKEQVINWIGQAEWELKYSFIKSILAQLPEKEVKTIQNLTNKVRRDWKTKRRERKQAAQPAVSEGRDESAPIESVPLDLSKGWWRRYKLENVVSLDCEHVHITALEGKDRVKAGTVSIVNHKQNEIYFAKIYHKPGTFIVNDYTFAVNGFRRNSLENGKDIEDVKHEVADILENKLIVTYGGGTDFESLGLSTGDFDTFDLAEHFRKPKPNKRGSDKGEPIGLRTLCHHYFGVDIQSGIHSPTTDAGATVRLFSEVYVKQNAGLQDRYFKNFARFKDIVKFSG